MTAMGGQMGELAAQMMQPDGSSAQMGGSVEELRRQMATLGQDMAGLRAQMMGPGAQAGMMEMGQQLAGITDHVQTMTGQMGDISGMMNGPGTQMSGMGGMNMGYNYFTINGKAYPATETWSVKQDDKVRVRIVNISNLAHPMHLHGMDFKVVAKDGEPVAPANQQWMNTLSVDPGETYDIAFIADNPGNWMFHCHELHHTENAGVEPGGLMQVIKFEGYQGYAGGNAPAPAPARRPSMPGMGH
jgi:FtsP/CotA-like multicopper oxidase with cupredoxin domain